jgi:hypothetical protein
MMVNGVIAMLAVFGCCGMILVVVALVEDSYWSWLHQSVALRSARFGSWLRRCVACFCGC